MTKIDSDISVIDGSNYGRLKEMLNSNDAGSINVAMNIMEVCDFEKSQVYIICLLKECDAINSDVRYADDFPKLEQKVRDISIIEARSYHQLSFRKILELVKSRGNNPEKVMHFMNIYKDEFVATMTDFGFRLLEELDIEFKLKQK